MPSISVRVADAMRVEGYLPSDSSEFPKATKAKLVSLLVSPDLAVLKQKPVPRPSSHASLWVSAADFERLQRFAGDTGMSEGETATALLLRDFDGWMKTQHSKVKVDTLNRRESRKRALHKALEATGRVMRDEQRQLLAALDKLTDDPAETSRVLFCEAGTGIGKTLGYLGHAIDVLADKPEAKVAVAAPSFALLRQIQRELQAFPTCPPVVFLAGQGEWISSGALRAFLLDEGHRLPGGQEALVREWLSHQDNERVIDERDPVWSKDSLLRSVPDFAFSSDVLISQREHDEDPGYLAYLGQFAKIDDARLVVMTHAMLASLLKRRLFLHYRAIRQSGDYDALLETWSALPKEERERNFYAMVHAGANDVDEAPGLDRLPNFEFLVIDEAHLFEDAVERIFSEFVSLRRLVQHAESLRDSFPSLFSTAGIDALRDIERRGKTMGQTLRKEAVDLGAGDPLPADLRDALEMILSPKRNVSKAKLTKANASPDARRLSSVLRSLKLVSADQANGGLGQVAYIHWSPRRDYPRLTMGRTRLDREFHFLWSVVAHRTALVSGTLYEEIPRANCETTRRALSVPLDMMLTMTPIHARWQIDPVTLHVVRYAIDPTGRVPFAYRPSSRADAQAYDLQHALWIEDVARYTAQTYQSSVGGVLVLGTAFSDLDALAEKLKAQGVVDVLQHRPGVSLVGLRVAFIDAARQGRKPILLATGAAWTGFDVYDPQLPDLLTDLVILNAPFGLYTKTLVRLRRMASRGGDYFAITAHALVMVRQALGRLVRSPETPHNRRVHWLDVRIHDPASQGTMAPIRRFLARYKQVPSA